jgi:hypothetical protein
VSVVDFECWRIEHDERKRSTQSRVVPAAEQHGKLTVVKIGRLTPEITGLFAALRSNLYSLKIAVSPGRYR